MPNKHHQLFYYHLKERLGKVEGIKIAGCGDEMINKENTGHPHSILLLLIFRA